MKSFKRDDIAEVQLFDTDAVLTFLLPREDDKTINRLAGDLEIWNKQKSAQVAQVFAYIENDRDCKNMQLLAYFGELADTPCGQCSVCNSGPVFENQSKKSIDQQVLEALDTQPMSSQRLSMSLKLEESSLLDVLRDLLDLNKIGINLKNQYYKV